MGQFNTNNWQWRSVKYTYIYLQLHTYITSSLYSQDEGRTHKTLHLRFEADFSKYICAA